MEKNNTVFLIAILINFLFCYASHDRVTGIVVVKACHYHNASRIVQTGYDADFEYSDEDETESDSEIAEKESHREKTEIVPLPLEQRQYPCDLCQSEKYKFTTLNGLTMHKELCHSSTSYIETPKSMHAYKKVNGELRYILDKRVGNSPLCDEMKPESKQKRQLVCREEDEY